MAGTQPQSISIKDLSSAVDRAVKLALEKYPKFASDEVKARTAFDPWRIIIGIIFPPPASERTVREYTDLATEVTTQLSRDATLALKPLEPVVYIGGGHTTVGFVPPVPIQFPE
jgi:hypothetical protein